MTIRAGSSTKRAKLSYAAIAARNSATTTRLFGYANWQKAALSPICEASSIARITDFGKVNTIMKYAMLVISALLTATQAIAQVQADGFVRIPGNVIGTDDLGRFVVCPAGTKATGTDCEASRTKKRVKGELPQDFLARTRAGAEYAGVTLDGAANGGAVIYYRVNPPCLGPNGSNTRPDGSLWMCSRSAGGRVILH